MARTQPHVLRPFMKPTNSPATSLSITTTAAIPPPSEMLFRNWAPVTTKPCLTWDTPVRAGSRTQIPLEIFHEIFSHLKPSQDDAFSDKEHLECFRALMGVCKYFATVARPVIWSSAPFCVSTIMTTDFVTSVALGEGLSVHLASFVKHLHLGDHALALFRSWQFSDAFLEDGFGETVAAALARMPVEELSMTDVVLTKNVLKLVKVVAPHLKVLKIAASCSLSRGVSDDELKAVFGAMQNLEELSITGRSSQCRLMQSPCILPISNLRRLCTDALFTIDSCIAKHSPLTHLEIDGMEVSWHDTLFLYTRLQAFPSLTHIEIHDVFNTHFGQMPMEIPYKSLPNLVAFKAPPGLLPKFFSLGPKLQVLDSTGTNSDEPYADSSHPFLDPGSADFTTTNIRELVVFDCNLNSPWVVPPVDKPVPHLRVMKVMYTGTADNLSNEYTVPRMFEEIGTMCEDRETRFPVEELVITFEDAYFTIEVGRSKRDCSWVLDLEKQLEMIEGLADGLPELNEVLFHGGFVAWVKDEEGEGDGEWKPRMLNAKRFKAVTKLTMKKVEVVDYMGCFEPYL